MKYHIGFLIIAIVLSQGCVEKFEAPATIANKNFLVVDGSIKSGADSTIIKLSRTRNLGDSVSYVPELNAHLFIEKDGVIQHSFQDLGNGRYFSFVPFLDKNSKYRLRIETSGGKQYLSDEMPVMDTPPIDSVPFVVNASTVTFFVNTHDPKNNTWYYQWEYEETWEYHSKIRSELEYVNGEVIPRVPANNIFICYRGEKSSEILLGSSFNLAEDIIYQQRLFTIPPNSIKVSVRYSLLVKQYALTREAYTYWQNIKKTTEQLGSIFDAQPSQFRGNIHSLSDSTEPVLGYISASFIQEKRIFVTAHDLEPWYYSGRDCEVKILGPGYAGNALVLTKLMFAHQHTI
jgi:hypothetical protein